MKRVLKKTVSFLLVYIGLTVLFVSLMYAAYSLPNNKIRGHVSESIGTITKEGIGYSPFFLQAASTLDTHTDALILNIALNKGTGKEESTIQKSINNSFHESVDENGITSLQENISDTSYNNHEYTRYWHGIQIIVRPLLVAFNYMEIRYIFMVTIVMLIAIVISMIGKQLGTKHAIAFSIAIALIYVILIPISLQYSAMFSVTLISMIAILEIYKHKKDKFLPIAFFIIGAFATFFDLLTYPLVTFGFPIILSILFESKKGTKLSKQILIVIKLGILWSLGYGLLFFTKWIIASILLNKDAIKLALDEILFRVNGSNDIPVDRIGAMKINFEYFFIPIAKFILCGISIIWVIIFILYRKKLKNCKHIITLIIIALIPYVWYIIFAGHSEIHAWFTNKIQAITVFSILSAMFEMIDERRIGTYISRKKLLKEEKDAKIKK